MTQTFNMGIWLLAVVLLIGCQNDSDQTPKNSLTNSLIRVTITDRLDREVRMNQVAQRIVSLSPATTELLFELGLKSSIVGVTKHCNFPPAALKIPRVGGGTLESLSLEAIVSAQPDLVLCKWDFRQSLVQSLERLKIPTLAIGAQNLDELFEEAQWIGQLTDRELESDALVASMRTRRDKLTKIVSHVQPTASLKVFYEVWDDPLMTAGPDSFIDELWHWPVLKILWKTLRSGIRVSIQNS